MESFGPSPGIVGLGPPLLWAEVAPVRLHLSQGLIGHLADGIQVIRDMSLSSWLVEQLLGAFSLTGSVLPQAKVVNC